MKAIQTLALASALATVAGAANATVWPITMYTNTYLASAAGPLIIDYTGTYDDVTKTGTVGGEVAVPGFFITIHYISQTFTMDPSTGEGTIFSPDSSPSNCTDNTGSGCLGFSPAFQGSWYNDINSSADTFTGVPFTLDAGSYIWTLVVNRAVGGSVEHLLFPFTVTFAPTIPVPATAWLFGSGLIGLAGVARKRKST